VGVSGLAWLGLSFTKGRRKKKKRKTKQEKIFTMVQYKVQHLTTCEDKDIGQSGKGLLSTKIFCFCFCFCFL